MQKQKMVWLGLGICAGLLGGCTTDPVKTGAAPAPEKVTAAPVAKQDQVSLSDEARKSLAQAEADVKEAQARKALWTTAQDALKAANEAAKKGDSDAVIKHSAKASEHARLGMEQLKYPLTTVPK